MAKRFASLRQAPPRAGQSIRAPRRMRRGQDRPSCIPSALPLRSAVQRLARLLQIFNRYLFSIVEIGKTGSLEVVVDDGVNVRKFSAHGRNLVQNRPPDCRRFILLSIGAMNTLRTPRYSHASAVAVLDSPSLPYSWLNAPSVCPHSHIFSLKATLIAVFLFFSFLLLYHHVSPSLGARMHFRRNRLSPVAIGVGPV